MSSRAYFRLEGQRLHDRPWTTSRTTPGISGAFPEFTYGTPSTSSNLVFVWDGALVSPDGSLILVERESSRPVPLHIHGHLAERPTCWAGASRW